MTDFPWFQIVLIAAILALVAVQAYRAFAIRVTSPADTRDRSATYEIALFGLIALGVIILIAIGVYGANKSETSQPFDPSAYLVVLTLIVGAIKERQQTRSVDRMGQKLADSAPQTVEPGITTTTTTVEPAPAAPAGTKADPLIVAGAPEGSPPVRIKPEKKA